jgi:5-methylcytosine-specific restriction endonuclease McrA
MTAKTPSSLDVRTLARRLGELASDERHVQAEFLLHLDEFDRRRAYLDLGFGSLWTYCLEALHLREGGAGRRIAAMKVLRRFPGLADALRDGRLCLSTLAMLGPVLTEENAGDLLTRAAFRTAAEVDHLVASIRPRQAPREGIRRVSEPARKGAAPIQEAQPPNSPSPPERETEGVGRREAPSPDPAPLALADVPRPRAEVRAVSEGQWSLRVTIDRSLKDDLERLAALVSHKLPKGDLAAVLHEAVRCGLERHGKRRGAVRPKRKVTPKAPRKDPAAIPAELRRQVWERDGGCCAWVGSDGRRCASRWQLEVDHVDPVARGGRATLDRLRLLCRKHNFWHAEQVYGEEAMAAYRKGEFTDHIDSTRRCETAGEARETG